jgi:hypothetical protein
VFARRLTAQGLAASRFTEPHDVVAAMGAVQAQDWLASLWALGVRLRGSPTERDIVSAKGLVRMHALRGTWQWVAIEDVRWMLELVGQQLLTSTRRRYEGLGLDVVKSTARLEKLLRDGAKSRAELRAALKPKGTELMHMLWAAELAGVITTGEQRDTYLLLEHRVPKAKRRDRAEAAADLAHRYFVTRGPATLADFVWWSGLPVREARAALEEVKGGLQTDGRHYWSGSGRAPKGTWLLPAFDEYLIAYTDRDSVLEPEHVKKVNAGGGLLAPCVVVDGAVVGTWSRVLKKTTVEVAVRFFGEEFPVEAAVARYAAFLGRET